MYLNCVYVGDTHANTYPMSESFPLKTRNPLYLSLLARVSMLLVILWGNVKPLTVSSTECMFLVDSRGTVPTQGVIRKVGSVCKYPTFDLETGGLRTAVFHTPSIRGSSNGQGV